MDVAEIQDAREAGVEEVIEELGHRLGGKEREEDKANDGRVVVELEMPLYSG